MGPKSPVVMDFLMDHPYVAVIDAIGVAEGVVQCESMDKFVDSLEQKLKEAFRLGDRISSLKLLPVKSKDGENVLMIGLVPNGTKFYSTIIRGPQLTNLEAAASFRKFWGQRSECRRFGDLEVCEAVYFGDLNMAEKRTIWLTIIELVVKRHFKMSSERIISFGGELSEKLKIQPTMTDTGDEVFVTISSALEGLIRDIRNIKTLPLHFTSFQGISPSFRATEVFPPTKDSNQCRHTLQPLEVVVHLESSGKWPDELKAFFAVKGQFCNELANKFTSELHLQAKASLSYVDIFYRDFWFRLLIAIPKEVTLMRQIRTRTGVEYRTWDEVPDAEELYFRNEVFTKLSSAINAINTQHLIFGPLTRLVKRWIASQYLMDYVDELVIEVLVAYLFLGDYQPIPMSLFQGFLHFVTFLTSFKFDKTPLIVNFNNEIDETSEEKIQEEFKQTKPRPAMWIATPFDRKPSMLTRRLPWAWKMSLGIFQVLVDCAASAKHKLLSHVSMTDYEVEPIFSYPIQKSHIIILLKRKLKKIRSSVSVDYQKETIPILGFRPFQNYVQLLRKIYGQYALFLFDPYDEKYILVYWKDYAFKSHPMTEISKHPSQDIHIEATGKTFGVNIEAVLESIHLLGQGVIHKLEPLVTNWPVRD